MTDLIRIGGVSERDMDLMLLEEFVSSPEFARWFASLIHYGPASSGSVTDANRSVTNSTGESDLEVDFQVESGESHRILIENKVGAGFQPGQATRYRQRGDGYVRNGDIASYRTVLVAPATYFIGDTKGFDARVDYESILDWFTQRETDLPRYRYKISLLRSAIEKSTTGYQAVEDEPVSSFWLEYWVTVCRTAPELDMPEPGSKPSGSSFVNFRTPTLPKWMSLKHKLSHGNVDLELNGQADNLPAFRSILEDKMSNEMKLVRASKSAAIRIGVPPLDLTRNFRQQLTEISTGIRTVAKLQQWALEHLEDLKLE